VARVALELRVEEVDGVFSVCRSACASSRYCRVSAIVRSASSSSSGVSDRASEVVKEEAQPRG
jgi:hypothetical protein